MVDRASNPVSFNTGAPVAVQGSQMGAARPDADKFRTNKEFESPVAYTGDTAASRILGSILNVAGKLADQQVSINQEEAYLSGVAQAGTIESEEQLERDPITAAWAKAGYRDTMGKVALAENEAKVATDMSRMREVSPAEYNEYLAENRAKLLPSLEGMSRKSRQTSFASLMLNDRAAIKKQAAEHAKFQVETKTKAIQGSFRIQTAALNAAKATPEAYQAATTAAYGSLYSSIVDPGLPDIVRGKLVEDAAAYALSSDNQDLYKMIVGTGTTLADGSKGTLSQYLTWDSEVGLSKSYRESLNRTESFRAANFMDRKAKAQADWDNTDTPLMSHTQALALGEEGLRKGFMSADQFGTYMNDYYRASTKKVGNGPLAAAYASGDVGGIFALGKTRTEALDAWMETLGRKMPMQEAIGQLMKIGTLGGGPEALRKVGELLTPDLAQLGLGKEMNPSSVRNVQTVMAALDAIEPAGREGMYSALMSSFTTELQAKLMYMREGKRQGLSADQAVITANQRIVEEAKLTGPQRAALGAANGAADVEAVNSLEPRGLFASAMLHLKSIVSDDAAARLKVTPFKSWFENPERVAAVTANLKLATLDELQALNITNPHMDKDSRQTAALARVAARTVDTESGPFVIPRNVSREAFFGVPVGTPSDRIGAAMDEYFKPTKGNRMVYKAIEGQLTFQELSQDGKLVRSGTVDPRSLGPMVETQQKRQEQKFDQMHATGKTVRGKGGFVRFNGNNTAGVSNEAMFQLRDTIVKHEDVQGTPYKDASGGLDAKGQPIMTVGAGISSTSDFYPKPDASGKFTQAATDAAFMLASNAAAKQAVALTEKAGFKGQAAVQLLGELFYQSGPGLIKQAPVQEMLKAAARQDEKAAIAALKKTTAYVMAKPESARAKHYEATLVKLIKGQ